MGIDHYSRLVTTTCPLEGPNAGWVTTALESAFARCGASKHIVQHQAPRCGRIQSNHIAAEPRVIIP